MDKKIKLIVYLIGPAFLLLGLLMAYNAYQRLNTYVHVSGKVVAQNRVGAASHIRDYPVVEFTTKDGQIMSFEHASFLPINYWTGESVSVLYNPNNFYDASVNNFFELWLWPTLSLIIGLVGLLTAFKIRSQGTTT